MCLRWLILGSIAALSVGCSDGFSSGAGGSAGSAGTAGAGGDSTAGGGGAGQGGAGAEGGADPKVDIGCSDGTREFAKSLDSNPDVAGCAGGFKVAGVTTTQSKAPRCDRRAGNDGELPDGEGCSVEDLCARSWHVCAYSGEVSATKIDCSLSIGLSAEFWLTRQTQDASDLCVSEDTDNNIVGCGGLGAEADGSCLPLTRVMDFDHCTKSASWQCGDSSSSEQEAKLVTKSGPTEGGALCCRAGC